MNARKNTHIGVGMAVTEDYSNTHPECSASPAASTASVNIQALAKQQLQPAARAQALLQQAVIGNFNNWKKFDPATVAVWARIMRQLPASVLWLMSTLPYSGTIFCLPAVACVPASQTSVVCRVVWWRVLVFLHAGPVTSFPVARVLLGAPTHDSNAVTLVRTPCAKKDATSTRARAPEEEEEEEFIRRLLRVPVVPKRAGASRWNVYFGLRLRAFGRR